MECAGEKGELLKMSGENEQLQVFLEVTWCKGQYPDAVVKEEQVEVMVMKIIKNNPFGASSEAKPETLRKDDISL